jgi:hypothetical protein
LAAAEVEAIPAIRQGSMKQLVVEDLMEDLAVGHPQVILQVIIVL